MPEDVEVLAKKVLDIAFRVHTKLGPGLLERAYVSAMAYELSEEGLNHEREVYIPLTYEGVELDPLAYRADIIVEGKVLVEAKSVEELHPSHRAQTLTVLKLSGCPVGFLLNFGATRLAKGLQRVIDVPVTVK